MNMFENAPLNSKEQKKKEHKEQIIKEQDKEKFHSHN